MQDSLPDPGVLIADKLEDPLPENLNVLLNLARTELLDGLETDITVLGVSVSKDDVDIFSLPTDAHEFPLVWLAHLLKFLLVVLALLHSNFYTLDRISGYENINSFTNQPTQTIISEE